MSKREEKYERFSLEENAVKGFRRAVLVRESERERERAALMVSLRVTIR